MVLGQPPTACFRDALIVELTYGPSVMHACAVFRLTALRPYRGCSSVVEHLLAKERVESSNLFIRFIPYDVVIIFLILVLLFCG